MSQTILSVNNLSKKFRLYNSVAEGIKEVLHPLRKKYHREHWALRDISFDIEKGETVGIVGHNGSGKSTLLQILCGVMQPTSGTVTVNGRVSALLELGAGFSPEFSGRDNVYMNGALMGFSKQEIEEKFPQIEAFADIGEYIDQPVRTYSSGMFVRLAFACAVNVEPDILVVDEALSVGDMFFQAKCIQRIKSMMDRGVTLIFVSHDSAALKSICKKSILLSKGNMVAFDSSDKIIEKYFTYKVESQQKVIQRGGVEGDAEDFIQADAPGESKNTGIFSDKAGFAKRAAYQRIQNGKAGFANVQLLDEFDNEVNNIEFGQEVTLRMAVEAHEDIPLLSHGYHIRDRNGVDAVYSGSNIEDTNLVMVNKGDRYVIDWKFRAALMQGVYNISCILAIPVNIEMGNVDVCDFAPLAFQFEVLPRHGARLYGLVHWKNEVKIEKITGVSA